MFTGLVNDVGEVRRAASSNAGRVFTIGTTWPTADLSLGESIAVDGACLTVTEILGEAFGVEASRETLERTTLGDRKVGDRVHLERALRMADRLGGHLVLGHVDGVGKLVSSQPLGDALRLEFEAAPAVMEYVIEKGSITIDGVSLTVNGCDSQRFHVVIIPHTAGCTKLASYTPGTRVNLEADVIGKYVKKFVQGAPAGGVDRELFERWSAK